MNKYKYFGKIPVNLSGYGLVNPKEVIETDLVVNHPLFKVYREIPEKIYIKNPVENNEEPVKELKIKKYQKRKGK
jgi:hypothetical protein